MEGDMIFVKPSEVFGSRLFKSPDLSNNVSAWEHDEPFQQYNSSPESTSSFGDDQHTYSPLDECNGTDGKLLLDTIRQSLYTCSELLTSTEAPFPLDAFDESLLSRFMADYLHGRYGLIPRLKPHPMAASLAIAMSHPACLHLMLAHAAQYALFSRKIHFPSEQRQLEVVMMNHRGEALQLIRSASVEAARGEHSEPLMASIFALGLLDAYAFGEDTAVVHFRAASHILNPTGDPSVIPSPWLTRVIAYFECGFRGTASLIWDKPNFNRWHMDLNAFFGKLWCLQRPAAPRPLHGRRGSNQKLLTPRLRSNQSSTSSLQPNSILFDCLSRKPLDITNPTQQDRHEIVFQLMCLLILSDVVIGLQSNPPALQAYLTSVHEMVASAQLQNQSCNNIMWLIEVNDQSDAHTARVWAAIGRIWILRHVNFNVQNMVKDWLMTVLTGKPTTRPLKLDSFAFSYAS